MLGWLRCRRRSRQHPTPEQAFDALSQGFYMYSPISKCSGTAVSTGFSDDWDETVVLVCRAHYGRLRKMDARTLRKLERQLRKAFGKQHGPPADEEEEEAGLVLIGRDCS
jgi:hypothetical protein